MHNYEYTHCTAHSIDVLRQYVTDGSSWHTNRIALLASRRSSAGLNE